MPNNFPPVNVDLEEVTARNNTAQHIIEGFASVTPTLAEVWSFLQDAFNDVPVLAAEITRLADELANTRLNHANLLAAARATIAAHHDGETDPLSYLRDELAAQVAANGRRA